MSLLTAAAFLWTLDTYAAFKDDKGCSYSKVIAEFPDALIPVALLPKQSLTAAKCRC